MGGRSEVRASRSRGANGPTRANLPGQALRLLPFGLADSQATFGGARCEGLAAGDPSSLPACARLLLLLGVVCDVIVAIIAWAGAPVKQDFFAPVLHGPSAFGRTLAITPGADAQTWSGVRAICKALSS